MTNNGPMADIDKFFGAKGVPDELVRQIWLYAAKCPHDDLGAALLRRALTPRLYDRLLHDSGCDCCPQGNAPPRPMAHGGIRTESGHIVQISMYDLFLYPMLTTDELSLICMDIDMLRAMPQLTHVKLPMMGRLTGNISVFSLLRHLVHVDLYGTSVYGDVRAFSQLPRLTHLYLGATDTNVAESVFRGKNGFPALESYSLPAP